MDKGRGGVVDPPSAFYPSDSKYEIFNLIYYLPVNRLFNFPYPTSINSAISKLILKLLK